MNITVDWLDNPRQIILFKVSGEWTWEEMDAARIILYQMLDSREYPIYVVYDYSEAGRLPANSFIRMRRTRLGTHASAAFTSIVGMSPVYRMMLETFLKIYSRFGNPAGLRLFTTVDEVVQFINNTGDPIKK
jgi:hypothetical protein